MHTLLRFMKDDSGVTSIEYAMIAGVTCLVLIATLPALEGALNTKYSSITTAMQ